MTPHEKAVNALNQRLERLQVNLRESESESTARFLVQSVVVSIAVGEALNDYIKQVGEYAKRRHGELKQVNEDLAARHAELLASGKGLLEQFKANPTDRAIQKEIERVQRDMEGIQKNLRRSANALQRDVAPSVAMIDQAADSVRRFGDAEDATALKRVLTTIAGQVRELYSAHPDLPVKQVDDGEIWEQSAVAELDQAAGFFDAYARAGYNVILAFELMALAVSQTPPETAENAMIRANDSAAARIKAVTARFGAGTP